MRLLLSRDILTASFLIPLDVSPSRRCSERPSSAVQFSIRVASKWTEGEISSCNLPWQLWNLSSLRAVSYRQSLSLFWRESRTCLRCVYSLMISTFMLNPYWTSGFHITIKDVEEIRHYGQWVSLDNYRWTYSKIKGHDFIHYACVCTESADCLIFGRFSPKVNKDWPFFEVSYSEVACPTGGH